MSSKIVTNKLNIKVRLAKFEDKEAVLKFCKNTWKNQSDYIHLVWDKWFIDSQGKIFVATINNIPVGIVRVLIMSECEAWWEGLRVDPDYRGMGIASILLLQIDKFAIKQKIKVSRNCTSSDNQIMNQILMRRGFKKVGIYSYYKSKIQENQISKLIQLNPQEFDSIWMLMNQENYYTEKKFLYVSKGMKWQKFDKKQLNICLKEGRIWGYKEKNKLTSFAVQSHLESSKDIFWIGYMHENLEHVPFLLLELQKLGFEKKYAFVGGFFTVNNTIINTLEKALYNPIGSMEEVYIYEFNYL